MTLRKGQAEQSCQRQPSRTILSAVRVAANRTMASRTVANMTQECGDCGASGDLGTCSQLFDALLALDLQRLQPWGRFHGLNVACFLLQHPSYPLAAKSTTASGGQWQHVTTFVNKGLDAVHELETHRVRANRQGKRPWLAVDLPPPRVHHPHTTIEDVSVDGTFPAEGYPQRMRAWAKSVIAERIPD